MNSNTPCYKVRYLFIAEGVKVISANTITFNTIPFAVYPILFLLNVVISYQHR